ncbi:MAG: glycosyltransferase [Chitinivibrionales bacterium]|nr:glycosyltransferase [Chitinivibrionales bacterium]
MRPLVSVIIPTYNRSRWVVEAINSVLAQTMTDREIIVVDDGSTDDTMETLVQYKRKIRMVSRRNGGPAAARNYGTMIALGEWVCFLDSDDEWGPRTLESHVNAVAAHPKTCVHLVNARLQRRSSGMVDLFEHTGFAPHCREVIERPLNLQLRYGMAWPQCAMIRRRTFEHIGGFDERFRVLYEDFDLFCRLGTQGPWAFEPYPHARILRRIDDIPSVSSNRFSDPLGVAQAMVLIFTKLAMRDDLTDEEREIVQRRLVQCRRGWGVALMRNGAKREARHVFAHCFQQSHEGSDVLRYVTTFMPRSVADSAARMHARRNHNRRD